MMNAALLLDIELKFMETILISEQKVNSCLELRLNRPLVML